jgi:hypothetical protein
MATNADDTAVDDSKEVTDEDFKKLKEESAVETSTEADEELETGESEEKSEEASEEDETSESQDEEESSEFVKEFPNIKGDTPEEYARNLEIAYENSTAEFQRLRDEAKTQTTDAEETEEDAGPVDPRLLYLDQMLQKDITDSYTKFSKDYPQTSDPVEYARFQTEAANLSQYIIQTQKRVAPASELYSKVAAILGWKSDTKPDSNDKLKVALKDGAASTKTSSATKPKSTSKVTDAEIATARAMGGWTEGKSDAEIRKELEAV